ncbi:MAG: cupin domain-containing protein [Ornithinimicrobium sp.]|uniref:cupin domain-containing protein n=1 Tax=Ornithinimicrobium sp. TaxID=1977084 RepID=UPI0026E00CAB|nr:cupin domain-containing protein [Ornithinimicrobium sp.]MDO5741038.1 cupin domain-containing protein [Ornithinimicrobium sp.]
MDKLSLQAKARELAARAAQTKSGRAADTIFGGHEKRMRQTLIALQAGQELAEHDSPGEATLLVISGRVQLVAGTVRWPGREWDHLTIPDAPHSVEAQTDAVFLLTVAVNN